MSKINPSVFTVLFYIKPLLPHATAFYFTLFVEFKVGQPKGRGK
jgi:hypothetical protein